MTIELFTINLFRFWLYILLILFEPTFFIKICIKKKKNKIFHEESKVSISQHDDFFRKLWSIVKYNVNVKLKFYKNNVSKLFAFIENIC